MKKIIIIIVFFTTFNLHSQWKPAGYNIKTKWADNIDPENVLKEYPRPLLVRKDWKNLNGLWDYSITGKGMSKPKSFDGKITNYGIIIILVFQENGKKSKLFFILEL